MRLSDAVSDAVTRGRGSGSYMGTVTAIDVANFALTVDIGTGTPLTGVRWITSYAPVVGDFVVVLRVGSGWWVMGKNSKNLTAGGTVARGELALSPVASWTGQDDSGWTWSAAQLDEGLPQGVAGWGGTLAGISTYTSITGALPTGATVVSGKLRTRRLQPSGDGSGGVAVVAPTIRGHAYTEKPFGAPGWSTAPWSPGTAEVGQIVQWDLPSAWLLALLAGAMRGVGMAGDTFLALSFWEPPVLILSYTTPL